MKHYTLVFLFNHYRDMVVLIHKLRPDWQSGLLNGVGGKVEDNELPLDAAYREIEEETGLTKAQVGELLHFADLSGTGYHVFCYRGASGWASCAESKTDEFVSIYPPRIAETEKVVPNLGYLLPLALHLPAWAAPVTIQQAPES